MSRLKQASGVKVMVERALQSGKFKNFSPSLSKAGRKQQMISIPFGTQVQSS